MPLIPEPDPKPKLREGLPIEKAVQVAVVEDGWPDFYRNVIEGLKKGRNGGKADRTAMRLFEAALRRVGHLAQPVQRLLDELNVESVEHLRSMVDAYRLGERATPEDRFELALQTLEQHIRNNPGSGDIALARLRVLVGKEGT